MQPPTAASPVGRLGGIDAARGLAIVGMVSVHFAPRPQHETGLSAWLLGVPFGKASVLFALVAGVGVSLLAARRPGTVRLRLLYRATWLLPLGLWLQELEHPVAVILQYYAVWFLLATLFLHLADRWLLVAAATISLSGSVAVAWVGIEHPGWLQAAGGLEPGGVVRDLLLTGYYPSVTWLPVLLVGMWLGRRELSSPRVRTLMVAGGSVVLTVCLGGGALLANGLEIATDRSSWWRLLSIDGHSEMPLAVLGAAGLAVAAVGACLVVVDRWPRTSRPVVAMGQGALSVYVTQLLIWPIWPRLFHSSSVADAWTVIGWFTVISAAAMTAWLAVFRRGPLEAAVRLPWERAIAPMISVMRGESLVPTAEADGPPATSPRSG